MNKELTYKDYDSLLETNFKFAQQSEGLRLKPYRCPAGKLTIGYGHNLEDKGITELEAEDLLIKDLIEAQGIVNTLVVNKEKLPDSVKLNQIIIWQQILTDMAFNLGKDGLSKFKKFLAALSEYRFDDAIVEMIDSQWFNQVGNRSKLLVIAGQSLTSLGYNLDEKIAELYKYAKTLPPIPERKDLPQIDFAFYYELYQWYLARLAKLVEHKLVIKNLPPRFKKELDKALSYFTYDI